MIAKLVCLEEIRAELTDDTVEEIEAKKHLDALAWWLSQFERRRENDPYAAPEINCESGHNSSGRVQHPRGFESE